MGGRYDFGGACYDSAEGPDGKAWIKFYDGWDYGVAYMDKDGYHPLDILRWTGGSIDIFAWQGEAFMVYCDQPYDASAGGYVLRYGKPSFQEMERVAYLSKSGRLFSGVIRSGDYLAICSSGPLRTINLCEGSVWDLPGEARHSSYLGAAGCNGYFWVEELGSGLLQVDAQAQTIELVSWSLDFLAGSDAEGYFGGVAVSPWGLWVFGKDASDEEGRLFLGVCSFQHQSLDQVRWIPVTCGVEPQTREMPYYSCREMSARNNGELWFTTEKAVCRWRLEDIPMPFEARVEATVKDGGVEVSIEFDNLRIIRNDATLNLDIEYFVVGQDEPLPNTLTFDAYFEFQPQGTFTYSFDHLPEVPEGADELRYSVYTTYIDVNAPPTDEEMITSNVAAAEVMLNPD